MVAHQSKNVKTADDEKVILKLQMKVKNVVTALKTEKWVVGLLNCAGASESPALILNRPGLLPGA